MAGNADRPVDLHTHTTASDGSDAPERLVRLAAERGIAAIAITDHDTVAGIAEAGQAASRFGVELITGVEISAEPPERVREARGVVHVLGYLIDLRSERLTQALAWMQERRTARNPEIIRKLNELGIDLTLDEVSVHAQGGQIGRLHVAQALVEKGVANTVQEAFDQYLRSGGPAAVEKGKLSPSDAIEAISAAGGIAVLAHPHQLGVGDGDALEETTCELVEWGLGGIESRYTGHSPEQTERYREIAARYGLAETGGSDYHGGTNPEVPLGLIPPVPYLVVDRLRERCTAGRTV